MDPQAQPKPKADYSGLFMILAWVLAGIFLVVIIILVVLYSNAISSRNQQISQLQAQNQQLQKTNDELKAGIKDNTATIPELNMRYPLNDTTKKIVYIVDTKDSDHPAMLLSTKPLMLAQLAASRLSPAPQRNACGAAEGAAGTMLSYKLGETFNGKAVETIQSKDVRKIGDNFWIYQPAPSTCSTNQTVQDEQKNATDQARVFFASLESTK